MQWGAWQVGVRAVEGPGQWRAVTCSTYAAHTPGVRDALSLCEHVPLALVGGLDCEMRGLLATGEEGRGIGMVQGGKEIRLWM